MVDKWGKLRPSRLTSEDFLDLASQLDSLLPQFEPRFQYARFQVTLDNLREYCFDIQHLQNFLRDVSRKVVREFELVVFGQVGSGPPSGVSLRSSDILTVGIRCGSFDGNYTIRNAPSSKEANGMEAAIVGFRNRHGTNRFLSPWIAYFLSCGLILVLFLDSVLVSSCVFLSSGCLRPLPADFWLGFRPLHVVLFACIISVVAYIFWSYYTIDTPPRSFRHTVLYMDKELGNNIFWILVFGLLFAIISGALLNLLWTWG